MGRRKIAIKPICDDRNRAVTFIKRKGGLFKKAYELSVLCQVQVALVIVGDDGKAFEFCSSPIEDIMGKYRKCDVQEQKTPESYADTNHGRVSHSRSSSMQDDGSDTGSDPSSIKDVPLNKRTPDQPKRTISPPERPSSVHNVSSRVKTHQPLPNETTHHSTRPHSTGLPSSNYARVPHQTALGHHIQRTYEGQAAGTQARTSKLGVLGRTAAQNYQSLGNFRPNQGASLQFVSDGLPKDDQSAVAQRHQPSLASAHFSQRDPDTPAADPLGDAPGSFEESDSRATSRPKLKVHIPSAGHETTGAGDRLPSGSADSGTEGKEQIKLEDPLQPHAWPGPQSPSVFLVSGSAAHQESQIARHNLTNVEQTPLSAALPSRYVTDMLPSPSNIFGFEWGVQWSANPNSSGASASASVLRGQPGLSATNLRSGQVSIPQGAFPTGQAAIGLGMHPAFVSPSNMPGSQGFGISATRATPNDLFPSPIHFTPVEAEKRGNTDEPGGPKKKPRPPN